MTQGAPDLGNLVQRAQSGDPEATPQLIEALYPLVIRIVRSHLPVRSAEEDLAQDVFVKLLGNLHRYQARPGISFENWAARISVRTCLDALRAERRRPERRFADLSPEEAAWLEYIVQDHPAPADASPFPARSVLEHLLAQLSPRDRLVIHRLDLEEKSVQETAAITGWSKTMVKVQAFRARRKLKKLATEWLAQQPYEKL